MFIMGFKSYITKKALQLKGVSADQAESIAKQLDENPELAESLKALESNKEVKELFEKSYFMKRLNINITAW